MAPTQFENENKQPRYKTTILSQDASGGVKLGSVRYVLAIGIILAVVAIVVAWKMIAH